MDTSLKARKRVVLGTAIALFVVYMALPVLATTSSALDGVVDGIGVAYIYGFVVIVGGYVVAVLYCRWAERVAIAAGAEDEDGHDVDAGPREPAR